MRNSACSSSSVYRSRVFKDKLAGYSPDGIKQVGQIIRSAREARKMSLRDLTKKTGYPSASIAVLETGKKGDEDVGSVNVPLLVLLCKLLKPINPETGAPYHPWELLSMAISFEGDDIQFS